ncbi:MAG: VOC family protein [Pseudomonadales bacterium]
MIGKLYHLAHMVEDLAATDRLFFEVFSCLRPYHDYEDGGKRYASLAIIADQCFEPIHPSDDPADADTPLARYRARFGDRMHSIAWYADDVQSFARRLLDYKIRLIGLNGRPVTDPEPGMAVWTHPRDTGVLIEFAEPGFAADPRLGRSFKLDLWRNHPLALLRTSHVTVLTHNLDHADWLYGEVLGGSLLHRDTTNPATPRAYYAIGEDTVIDAVAPATQDTPEGADYAAAGKAVHAITFATADLAGACRFLASHNISVTEAGPNLVWLNLDPGHGLRMGLTDIPIPGDLRS